MCGIGPERCSLPPETFDVGFQCATWQITKRAQHKCDFSTPTTAARLFAQIAKTVLHVRAELAAYRGWVEP